MNSHVLNEKGQLKPEFRPAIYFDSSVAIDYLRAVDLEPEPDPDIPRFVESNRDQSLERLREIIKPEPVLKKMLKVRELLQARKSDTLAILSSFALLEIHEWITEHAFRDAIYRVASSPFAKKQGKKALNKYAQKIYQEWIKDKDTMKPDEFEKSPIKQLVGRLWPDPLLTLRNELSGLTKVNVRNICLNTDDVPGLPTAFAFFQLGAADIMHIIIAKHLQCDYIATSDDGFGRVSDLVSKHMEMTVLKSPEEIIKILVSKGNSPNNTDFGGSD